MASPTLFSRAITWRAALTFLSGMCALIVAVGTIQGSASAAVRRSAAGSPLRIGLIVDATGPATSGENHSVPVIQGWAKAVNASGGIAGHRVKIVVDDDKGSAPAALADATNLANDKSVIAIVGVDGEAEGVWGPVIAKAGLPVIGGIGFDPGVWTGTPNFFSQTTTFPALVDSATVLAKSLGTHTVALVVCAEVPNCAAIAPIAQGATQKLGLDYAGTVKVAAAEPDYTAECLQMINEKVDFMALADTTPVNLRVAQDCKQQGYQGQSAVFAGFDPNYMIKNDSSTNLNVVLGSFPWWVSDAPVAAYRAMMKAEHVSSTEWADPHSTAVYATMELFKTTLDANASTLPAAPTRQSVIKAYGTIKDQTLGGLLPQAVTFTPNKDEPTVNCYWFAKFRNGKFSGALFTKPVCDPSALQ